MSPSPCEVGSLHQSWHIFRLFSSPREMRSTKVTAYTKVNTNRVPCQQVDSSWGSVAPVHELLTVMPWLLQISHCTREVSFVSLQGDQPINCASHILLCFRIVLKKGFKECEPYKNEIDGAQRYTKLCSMDPLHHVIVLS